MKQTLLILGDSFADAREEEPDHTGLSWSALLARSEEYKVINKSIGGSSLYYSKLIFDELHNQFDKVILVVTLADRLYLPIDGLTQRSSPHHTSNLWFNELSINYIKKTNPNNITGMKQLEAVRDYFLYICNWEKDYYINQLILDDIKKIRPDIILIPAFQVSWSSPSHPISYLNQISDMEIKHWNLSQDDVSSATGYVDCRKCHMSERNNQILFEKSLKWLKGDPVEFDLSDFEKPTEPREKYFPTRKEWEMRFSNK
jgi:hypothetical protein